MSTTCIITHVFLLRASPSPYTGIPRDGWATRLHGSGHWGLCFHHRRDRALVPLARSTSAPLLITAVHLLRRATDCRGMYYIRRGMDNSKPTCPWLWSLERDPALWHGQGQAAAHTVRLTGNLHSSVVPTAGGTRAASRSITRGAGYLEGLQCHYLCGRLYTTEVLQSVFSALYPTVSITFIYSDSPAQSDVEGLSALEVHDGRNKLSSPPSSSCCLPKFWCITILS